MAAFTPFFTENLYQNMKNLLPEDQRFDSIHYGSFPEYDPSLLDDDIVRAVSRMQQVIEMGRTARTRKKRPFKYPLGTMIVYLTDELYQDDLQRLEHYILKEMNIKQIVYKLGLETDDIKLVPKINKKLLGTRLRKDAKKVEEALVNLTQEQLSLFEQEGKIEIAGFLIEGEELLIFREYCGETERFEACSSKEIIVVLDCHMDEEMELEGISREISNRVQKLRKEAQLLSTDEGIRIFYNVTGKNKEELEKVRMSLNEYLGIIQQHTKTILLPVSDMGDLKSDCTSMNKVAQSSSLELKLVKK